MRSAALGAIACGATALFVWYRRRRVAGDVDSAVARSQILAAKSLRVVEGYSGPEAWTVFTPGRGRFFAARPVTLSYFAIRGPGALPVMILEAAGYPYRVQRVMSGPLFKTKLKGSTPFGRFPLVRDGAETIAQSAAVVRHLGFLTGLDGGSAGARACADALYEMLKESLGELGDLDSLKELPPPDEVVAYTAKSRVAMLEGGQTEKAFAVLELWEGMLSKSVSGWVLGSAQGGRRQRLTYVDLALWLEISSRLGSAWLRQAGFESIARHACAVEGLPAVHAYLHSPRMMPAMSPTYEYVPDKYVTLK
jgi:glutathione S-transferase